MSLLSVTELTSKLISIPSVSRDGNVEVSDYLQSFLEENGFEVERLSYVHEVDGQTKVSLVAKKGKGKGGFGFFSHSDVVPANDNQFEPYEKDGKLYGRGSCDMKGPLAASIVAAIKADPKKLKKPVYIVIAADEEYGFGGCKQISNQSQIFQTHGWPDMGVVPEPTEMIPVYAHKGGYHINVTAHGVAAHTSTEKGTSANFLIAPFLAEMAELKQRFMTDPHFADDEFEPATNGFNLTLDDGNCAGNVTAAKTIAKLNLRSMPKANTQDAVKLVIDKAKAHGFDVEHSGVDAFYVAQGSDIIKLSLELTGEEKALAVPYGTEALVYQKHLPLVILGPGNIAHAHTIDEYVDIKELKRSVEVYEKMIERHCY